MAQGRISGRLLKDDLARSTNLTFNTNTLVVDYTNGKIGIGTTTSGSSDKLVVNGNITATNINTTSKVVASEFVGDLKGSVFADDSVLLVDALSGQHFGDFVGDLKGSLVADDSTVIVDGVAGVIRSPTIVGDTTQQGHLTLRDNDKLKVGNGPDLEIYHDGSNSFIDDTGTGSIFIRSGTTFFQNAAGTKTAIQTNAGAQQSLFHNNVEKFLTTSTGVEVKGQIDGDLVGSVFGDDSTFLVDGVSNKINAAALVGTFPGFTTSGDIVTDNNDVVIGNGRLNFADSGTVSFLDFTVTQFGQTNNTVISSVKSINLFLDSNGGDSGQAFRIYNNTNPDSSPTEGNHIFKVAEDGAVSVSSTIDLNGTTLTGGSNNLTVQSITSDLKGSVVADDSTVLVDGVSGVIRGTVVTTQVDVDNIQIKDNEIISTNTNGDIKVSPNGSGNVNVDTSFINNVTDPVQDQDAATKAYVQAQISASGGGTMSNLVEDTTPQLGGALDVNGQKIVSVSNGDIDIEPNGTGDVLLGNFKFDVDQTVGSGQDNFVLTYDNSTGKISLEASTSGSVTAQAFSGDNSTVAFTLSSSSTTAGTLVMLNGIVQIPTTAYAVSGTTLTMTEAPQAGDALDVRIL